MRGPAEVSVTGPLAPWAAGYIDELSDQGYSPVSAAEHLRLMAHVSRWLERRGLQPHQLTESVATEFLAQRRDAGYASRLSSRAIAPLLDHLRSVAVAPSAGQSPIRNSLEQLLDRYCRYLRGERGLAPLSIETYQPIVRRFLVSQWPDGDVRPEDLSAADVIRFVERTCRGPHAGRASVLVSVLRSLLRFLYLEGEIGTQLAAAVPKVASWRLSALPRVVEKRDVSQLLHSCDRRTALGLRDHAILLLLIRLGLRASEVISLQLADLDWRRGEIAIHGKGPQQDSLPLLRDIGEALAAYLRRGRPRFPSRSLFLRDHAPYRGLTRHAVSKLVRHACDRAELPRMGPHRLRHTAASRMLAAGASLGDIAEVLRHRSLSSTAIYAKVDREALRVVAQPWPGGAR